MRPAGTSGGLQYDFGDVAVAGRTTKAMLVPMPFIRTGMTVDHLTASVSVQVSAGLAALSHVVLPLLIGCDGADTEANSEAGEA